MNCKKCNHPVDEHHKLTGCVHLEIANNGDGIGCWCMLDEKAAQPRVQSDGANNAALKAECEDCGLPYDEFGLDVTLPDEQWLAIHPSGINGLLCARCVVARAGYLENIVAVRAVLDDGTPRR